MRLLKGTCSFILLTLCFSGLAQAQSREVIELKSGWKFTRNADEKAYRAQYDDAGWETVSVPHDWAIYGPFDKEIDKQTVAVTQNNEKVATEKTGRTGSLPYIGEGWYRRKFSAPASGKKQKGYPAV
jgi:beta-galactosidase